MNKVLKTALTLVATGGFAISGVTPVAAESEQVHFYNSPAAAAFLHQNLLSISCYLSVSRSWNLTHRSQRCR
jgi:hypothetical protein